MVEGSVDLALPGRGVDFWFERTYNSDVTGAGPFGPGWTHNLAARSVVESNGDVSVVDGDGSVSRFVTRTAGWFASPAGVLSRLVAVAGGGWTLTSPDQERSTFDATGRLVSVVDRGGQGLALAYTAGRLVSVTDAGGRVVTLSYTTAGLVSAVTLPDGRQSRYTYTAGRLTKATDPAGGVTTYAYAVVAAGGRLLTVKDALNRTVRTLVYDAAGRAIDETDAVAKHTLVGWDQATQTASITDPVLGVSRDVYLSNTLVKQIDPRGTVTGASEADFTTMFARDGSLSRWRTSSPGGQLTKSFNDSGGHPFGIVDPAGGRTSLAYDGYGTVVSAADRTGRTTTSTTDATGRVLTSTAPDRGVTTYTYTPQGQVETITNPEGDVSSNTYDTAGNLTSITSFGGRTTSYTHDGGGRKLTQTDPRGKTTSYEYNARDQVAKITDPNGAATTFVYDAAGRRTSQTDPVGGVTAWVYDNEGRVTQVTDPRGGITRTAYDAAGRVASTTSATAAKTTYAYDPAGHVVSTTLPKGNLTGAVAANFTWTYTYDAAGNQLTRAFPGIGTYTTTFDALNRPVQTTDPLGRTTGKAYDAEGRVTGVTDEAGRTALTSYDSVGRVSARFDRRGNPVSNTYDKRGFLTEFSNRGSYFARTRMSYDGDGNILGQSDPAGHATNYGFDDAGNLTSVNDDLGHQTSYTYDDANRRVSQTDANNHTTRYGYDPAGRLTSVTGADAPSCGPGTPFDPPPAWCVAGKLATTYALDPAGNVTGRTDPNGHTTSTAYDLDNRPLLVTSPLGQKWSYTYDRHGNQVTKTTARGNAAVNPATGRIAYTYDPSDRLTKINYPATTALDVSFAYDSLGRRASMIDGTGTTSYTYDPVGYLTQVDRGTNGGAFTYTYDPEGNPLTRTRPDGSLVTSTYDPRGLLTRQTGPTGEFNFAYDPSGRLTQTALPTGNGYQEKRSYDTAGRLTSVSNEKGGSVLSRFTQLLDPVGNPLRVTTLRGATTTTDAYSYDPANRIQKYCIGQLDCSGTPDVAWTYDPVGNRVTQTHQGANTAPPTVAYTYNAGDQLTQAVTTTTGAPVTTSYTYDPDGNQVTAGADTNAYDFENRLITATRGATINRYTYTGDGNRYQRKLANTVKATWAWDTVGGLPEFALEKNTAGTVVRSYIQGPAGPLSETTTAGGTAYLHHDLIGSTSDATSETGAPTYNYQYHPYGEQRTRTALLATATEPAQRFTGETLDPETGLYNLRARQYDATLGRFTAADPVAAPATSPYPNVYAYADNQPGVLTDPSGQLSCFGICSAVANATVDFVTNTVSAVAHPIRTGQRIVDGCNEANTDAGGGISGRFECFNRVFNPAAGLGEAEVLASEGDYQGATYALTTDALGLVTLRVTPELGRVGKAITVRGLQLKRGVSLAYHSPLRAASRQAAKAAGRINEWTPKSYHLEGGTRRQSKFLATVDPRAEVAAALQKGDGLFLPNPEIPNSFRFIGDAGREIGTKGETRIRIIVVDGRVVNAFPVKKR